MQVDLEKCLNDAGLRDLFKPEVQHVLLHVASWRLAGLARMWEDWPPVNACRELKTKVRKLRWPTTL